MFNRILYLFLFSLPISSVQADWTDFSSWIDNGTYLTDPISGYDWLKLTETAGFTFTDLEQSGLLNEWSYVDDVASISYSNFLMGTDYDEALARLDAWGDLQMADNPYNAQSYVISGISLYGCIEVNSCDYNISKDRIEITGKGYSEELGDVYYDNPEVQIVLSDLPAHGPSDLDLSNYDYIINGWHGHALVRVSQVPVPAALWLSISAFFGLISLKHLKR